MKYLQKVNIEGGEFPTLDYGVVYYNESNNEVIIKRGEPFVPEMVDLGLSVLWASCNVGATKPEEYGKYFQWADAVGAYETPPTTSKNYSWETTPYYSGSTERDYTKYKIGGKS